MYCKISFYSSIQFVVILAVISVVLSSLVTIDPLITPIIERFPILSRSLYVLGMIYFNYVLLDETSFNAKGYFVFSIITIILYCLLVILLIALHKMMVDESKLFPLHYCMTTGGILLVTLRIYYCMIGRTLLKYQPLIKVKYRKQPMKADTIV